MKHNYRTNIRKVGSLNDLRSEKSRLKEELLKSEESIHSSYRHIRDLLSFRNILKTVTDDITLATTTFSKTFSIGKSLFEKVKRKKKKKQKTTTDNPEIKTNE